MSKNEDEKGQFSLDLFGFFGDKPPKSKINQKITRSNTVAVYDALPKYSWSNKQPTESSITRSCLLQGINYEMSIEPALVKRIDPVTKEPIEVKVYPGEREEAIEDVLRGLAANGQGKAFGQEIGVYFTLKELRTELEKINRSYKHREVVEALMVCSKANLSIRAKGIATIHANLFPQVVLTDREGYEMDSKTKCFVRFHPMVTTSIINLDYRMLNYDLAMSIKDPLARHIYKRLVHYWRQASNDHHYEFKLMSYLAQTSRNISPRMTRNFTAMAKALDELVKKKVLQSYEVNEICEGRKLLDGEYRCMAHPDFIADVKKANYLASRRELLSTLPELPKRF